MAGLRPARPGHDQEGIFESGWPPPAFLRHAGKTLALYPASLQPRMIADKREGAFRDAIEGAT
jgi:hypothetical protein